MCRAQCFIVTFLVQEPKFVDEMVSFPCMSRRSSTFLMKIHTVTIHEFNSPQTRGTMLHVRVAQGRGGVLVSVAV